MLKRYRIEIDRSITLSKNLVDMKVEKYKSISMKNIATIEALSPLKTLIRGYSVVENKEGNVIKKVTDVKKDDNLKVILQDGNIEVIVK